MFEQAEWECSTAVLREMVGSHPARELVDARFYMWQTRQEVLRLVGKSQRNFERAQEIYCQFQGALRSAERFLSEQAPNDGRAERNFDSLRLKPLQRS